MTKRIIKLAIAAFVAGLIALAFTLSKKSGIQVTDDQSAVATQTVLISVSGTGTVQFDGADVAVSELADAVNQRIASTGSPEDLEFKVSAAQDADNILLIEVMDMIRKAGATNVSISNAPENAE